MKLLANENIPLAAVRLLRAEGLDVASISETAPSMADHDVLALARSEGRVVITFDRDYGELIYARRYPCPAGILYLRLVPSSAAEPADWILRMIRQDLPLEGFFTIFAGWDHVRQRPLRTA